MATNSMTQPVICPSCRGANSPAARFCQHCGHDVVLNNAGPRYFLTRVIKAGGQGAVYAARGDDGAPYAVKEMLDSFTDPAERAAAVARFEAEAATLRRLDHPRIPRVYASFNDEGRHYLVMELVAGEDLEEIVAREGAQPEPRVLAWADELCDVLGYLHDRGVVYRDMKPSNVMREHAGGGLKLIDFGIAKLFQAQARGTQIGTPGYAPPEQYQGLATPRSDVYALGATLHHLLSGRDPQRHPPFKFPPLRDLAPAVSAATEAAVARAVQMREEDRFASIADLRGALRPPAAVIAPAAAAAAHASSSPRAAAPAAPAARPAQPATAPPAAAPAPPAATAATPAPPPAAGAAAGAAAPGARRGRGPLLVILAALLAVAAGAAALILLRPGATAPAGPTATAQVLVAQSFTREIELLLPSGSADQAIDQAFAAAFLELARLDCACDAQIQPGTLVYLEGRAPARAAITPEGTRYRAALQATILVPAR